MHRPLWQKKFKSIGPWSLRLAPRQLDEKFVIDHPSHLHEGELELLIGEDRHLAALGVHPRQVVLFVAQTKGQNDESRTDIN